MLSVPENLCLILAFGETIMGTWINTFISLVNCIDWMKSRKFSLVNSMLLGLAFSRIFLFWMLTVFGVMRIFYMDIFLNKVTMVLLAYLLIMANDLSMSFSTCLNVFYFLKIAYFPHSLFLWLKWRINRIVLMILLGSLIMFLILNLPLLGKIWIDFPGSMEKKEEKNHTRSFPVVSFQWTNLAPQILLLFVRLILLIMSLISCFLLILSLWRHAKQMGLNAIGFRDPRIEAHIRVMRWMVSYIFLIIVYYVSIFIIMPTSPMLEKRLADLLEVAIFGFYHSAHSFILILGNSKMKKTSLWVWHQTLFCLQGGKP